jgi:hypothetical protein
VTHGPGTGTPTVGCGACYGEDAQAAWGYYARGLTTERSLVEESHLIVRLRRCGACGQPFVWIFTESVDWHGGEDPQYHRVVPVRPDEAAALTRQGERVDPGRLGALGRGRRHLRTDWPSDAPRMTIYWATGGFLVEHD